MLVINFRMHDLHYFITFTFRCMHIFVYFMKNSSNELRDSILVFLLELYHMIFDWGDSNELEKPANRITIFRIRTFPNSDCITVKIMIQSEFGQFML